MVLERQESEQSAAEVGQGRYLDWGSKLSPWARSEAEGLNPFDRRDALEFLKPKVNPRIYRTFADSPIAFHYVDLYTFGDYRSGLPRRSSVRERTLSHMLMMVNRERLRRDGYLPEDYFHVTTSKVLRKKKPDDLLVEPTSTLRREKHFDTGMADIGNRPRAIWMTGRVGPELLRIFLPEFITLPMGKSAGYMGTDLAVWQWPEINQEMWQSLKKDVVLSPENADRLRVAVDRILSNSIRWKRDKADFGQVQDKVEEVASAWRELGVLGFWQKELATPAIVLKLTDNYSADELDSLTLGITQEMERYIAGLAKEKLPWQKKPFPLAIHTRINNVKPALYMFAARPPSTVSDFIGIRANEVEHIVVDREDIGVAKDAVAGTLGKDKDSLVISFDDIEKTVGSCEVRYPANPNGILDYWLRLLTEGDAVFVFSSTGRENSMEVLVGKNLTPAQREAVRYGLFHITS